MMMTLEFTYHSKNCILLINLMDSETTMISQGLKTKKLAYYASVYSHLH